MLIDSAIVLRTGHMFLSVTSSYISLNCGRTIVVATDSFYDPLFASPKIEGFEGSFGDGFLSLLYHLIYQLVHLLGYSHFESVNRHDFPSRFRSGAKTCISVHNIQGVR